MLGPLWAEGDTLSGPVKVLAILGGAVVGALVVGFLTGLAVRGLTTRKMPLWARNVMRILGAVVGGWLVALWLFGGGGPGVGGTGGLGLGSGSGKGPTTEKGSGSGTSPTTHKRPGDTDGASLRVEVLGPDPLRKLAGGKQPDLNQCYRVEAPEGPRLLTFERLKTFINERKMQPPPLRRLTVVLYKDSPVENRPVVTKLTEWARDQVTENGEKLEVPVLPLEKDAPTQ